MNEKEIENLVSEFSAKLISLYKCLICEMREFIISKELLRSGMSLVDLLTEACNPGSIYRNSFSSVFSYFDETLYWINLLIESGYFNKSECENLLSDLFYLKKMVSKVKKDNCFVGRPVIY